MEKLNLIIALEKAIESIEDAMVTLYEAQCPIDYFRSLEMTQESLQDAWAECKCLMRKLNPPF